MIIMLYMAAGRTRIKPDEPLAHALRELGELRIVENGNDLSDAQALEQMQAADILITHWAGRKIPADLAHSPGKVRYIVNLGGTCKATVPMEIIRSGIPVTNWGDTPARPVAEGAMSLLLAVLKDLRPRIEHLAADKRPPNLNRNGLVSGTLYGTKVGLYGCGVIGNQFVKMLEPFEPELSVFDPYASDIPDRCERIESLDALFQTSEIVVVWAGWSKETEASVNAERLAMLPDHGIIINAARGEIIDQDALFAELKSGRLRGGLDVLVGDNYYSKGHEAHTWPNLILTPHNINVAHWPKRPPHLGYGDKIALDNIKRFLANEPLRFIMDESRYLHSS